MKLFYSPTSPYVRKVMIVLHETGQLDDETLETVATTPIAPASELLGKTPLTKVPALERPDGPALFDSRVICEYLDGLHSGEKMFPADGIDRVNALVTQSIGDGIMDAAVGIRYEQALRPEEKQWDHWMDGQFRKISQSLDVRFSSKR